MNANRLVLLLLCGVLSGIVFAAAGGGTPTEVVLYVSPSGSDEWSGRLAEPNASNTDGPLATLSRARNLLREIPRAQPARVQLRRGTYRLDEPLRLAPEDSGTEQAPRVYESYPGEIAVLAGARQVAGRWHAVRANVYALALDPAQAGTSRTLFIDRRRATWARYPNAGFLYATSGRERNVIELAPGTAKPAWANDPQATVNIVAEHGWYNEIVRLAAVGAAGETIEIAGREAQGRILPGNRFYVEGVREELDQEGEWYFDRAGATLYLCAQASPETQVVEMSHLDRLIDIRGRHLEPVEHIAFRRLVFFGSDHTVDHLAVRTSQDAAIHLVNAHAMEVSDCKFEAVGGYAVWLHLDSQDNVIRGNEIVDCGAGGVLLTGARFSYESDRDIFETAPEAWQVAPLGNVILENHIYRGGGGEVLLFGGPS